MTFQITDTVLGAYNPGSIDTVQNTSLGTRVDATDPILGSATFIYLKGVASTVAGSVVIYDDYAKTTTLAVAGSRGPVAVATAATVANTYGWYQVRGTAIVKETGAVAAGTPYVTATAGVPSVTVVATDKIDGMRFKTADGTPSAGFAYAEIAYPALNSNG